MNGFRQTGQLGHWFVHLLRRRILKRLRYISSHTGHESGVISAKHKMHGAIRDSWQTTVHDLTTWLGNMIWVGINEPLCRDQSEVNVRQRIAERYLVRGVITSQNSQNLSQRSKILQCQKAILIFWYRSILWLGNCGRDGASHISINDCEIHLCNTSGVYL